MYQETSKVLNDYQALADNRSKRLLALPANLPKPLRS